jgi:oligopeptide/dipeptide ABC transporter ATP-binding protein
MLEVKNLAISLTSKNVEVPLVDDVSFKVKNGEMLAIVGESGSGKSITSLAIMGLLKSPLFVSAGEIIFNGIDFTKLSPEEIRQFRGKKISMVFQEPMTSLNPVKTIGSQIEETIIQNLGLTKQQAKNCCKELLSDVGVADPEQRMRLYPHHFSGGMRQRVMIAIAIAANPELIIADEPTTALDVTIQAQILSLLSELCKKRGMAMLLITHNLGIVARYADKVSVMYGGNLVEQGTPRSIYRNAKHPYTAGLIRSVPKLDSDKSMPLEPISGEPADPSKLISGCKFHPRCPEYRPICEKQRPEFKDEVACHFRLDKDFERQIS